LTDRYSRENNKEVKTMAKLEILDVGESALLVRFGSEFGTQHFIFGKDSEAGQPFMTQVARKAMTLVDAFGGLMPKIVKEAIAQGLDVKRQGDWFFIPVEEPICKRSFEPKGYWSLDGRHVDGKLHKHVLYHSYPFHETRHTVRGEILFRAVGRHFVRGTVDAPDHPLLHLGNQWHLAVRRNSLNWENTIRRGDD
jgi:hypothetical protein